MRENSGSEKLFKFSPDSQKRKEMSAAEKHDAISKLIHAHLAEIGDGKYTVENLQSDSNFFRTTQALVAFLSRNFLTKNLKEIALGIQENKASDQANAPVENKPIKPELTNQDQENKASDQANAPGENGPIKLKITNQEKAAIRESIYSIFNSQKDKTQAKKKIVELMKLREFPDEKLLLKAFNANNFSEFFQDMYNSWDYNRINKGSL